MAGMNLTRADLEALKAKAQRAGAAVRNAKEAIAEQVGHVVRTAEVAGASFAFGVANGYTGGVEVVGIPLDLGLGVLGHFAAFWLPDSTARHVHALADGGVAAYSTVAGIGIGAKMKERQRAAALPAGAPAAAAGALPAASADRAMADAIRGIQQAAGVHA